MDYDKGIIKELSFESKELALLARGLGGVKRGLGD
jgi:hypothetical protein